jgi:excisionase family DNA binding protein
MNDGKQSVDGSVNHVPEVIACVVFRTRDPEQLIQVLTDALTGIGDVVPAEFPLTPTGQSQSTGSWLKHPEAAEYLGISPSTLYRYACQHRIEYRKLCGRLEYRRTALERFKDLHIHPPARWLPSGRIIPAALGSGK